MQKGIMTKRNFFPNKQSNWIVSKSLSPAKNNGLSSIQFSEAVKTYKTLSYGHTLQETKLDK